MKTTLELPDLTFRRAKTFAAARGITLKQLFTEALDEKLRQSSKKENRTESSWMRGFGQLSNLKTENARIMSLVEKEFKQVESEDRK
jgi:hypothetical protein